MIKSIIKSLLGKNKVKAKVKRERLPGDTDEFRQYKKERLESRLKWLTKEQRKFMKSLGEKNKCPSCKKKLDPIPKAKKKCPHCKEYIYLKTRPDRIKVLVTDKQREQIGELYDKFMNQRNLGECGFIPKTESDKIAIKYMPDLGNAKDYQREHARFTKLFGKKPSPSDVVWGLFNGQILELAKTSDLQGLKMVNFRMGLFMHDSNENSLPLKKECAKYELLYYKQSGLIRKVEISTAKDRSCKVCTKNHGKVYSIDEALSKMPIPNPKCTNDKNKKGFGWCRCMWISHF